MDNRVPCRGLAEISGNFPAAEDRTQLNFILQDHECTSLTCPVQSIDQDSIFRHFADLIVKDVFLEFIFTCNKNFHDALRHCFSRVDFQSQIRLNLSSLIFILFSITFQTMFFKINLLFTQNSCFPIFRLRGIFLQLIH